MVLLLLSSPLTIYSPLPAGKLGKKPAALTKKAAKKAAKSKEKSDANHADESPYPPHWMADGLIPIWEGDDLGAPILCCQCVLAQTKEERTAQNKERGKEQFAANPVAPNAFVLGVVENGKKCVVRFLDSERAKHSASVETRLITPLFNEDGEPMLHTVQFDAGMPARTYSSSFLKGCCKLVCCPPLKKSPAPEPKQVLQLLDSEEGDDDEEEEDEEDEEDDDSMDLEVAQPPVRRSKREKVPPSHFPLLCFSTLTLNLETCRS